MQVQMPQTNSTLTAVDHKVVEATADRGESMHALTFWSFHNKDIDRDTLEDAWIANGLDIALLPPVRDPVASLSRAVAASRGAFRNEKYNGQVSAHRGKLNKGDKTTVKAVWYVQISYVHVEKTDGAPTTENNVDFDELVGKGVDLYHESMVVWIRVDGTFRVKNMNKDNNGKALPMTDALTKLGERIHSKYKYNQGMLDSAKDLSGWLAGIVKSTNINATLVRPQGGLYLVLAERKAFWEKVGVAIEDAYSRNGNKNFSVVYTIPVVSSDDTSKLVIAALTAEYEELAAKITAEMEKSTKMRSDGLATRNRRIAELIEKLQQFESAMAVSTASLQESLGDLQFALDAGQVSAAVPEQERIVEEEEVA